MLLFPPSSKSLVLPFLFLYPTIFPSLFTPTHIYTCLTVKSGCAFLSLDATYDIPAMKSFFRCAKWRERENILSQILIFLPGGLWTLIHNMPTYVPSSAMWCEIELSQFLACVPIGPDIAHLQCWHLQCWWGYFASSIQSSKKIHQTRTTEWSLWSWINIGFQLYWIGRLCSSYRELDP